MPLAQAAKNHHRLQRGRECDAVTALSRSPTTALVVQERAGLIAVQWKKKASLYKTKHVLVPLGKRADMALWV